MRARSRTPAARSKAVEIYQRLVARWPKDAALYHDLAVAAVAAGMPAEAARAEQAALALQPTNAAASNGLGLLLVEAGKPGEAVAPSSAPCRTIRRTRRSGPISATRAGTPGDAARAEQAYRTALERDPRSPDAANGIGVLLVQQHRAPDAIRWFEQALAGSPRFVEARLNLGIAYQETGNREKAIATYRQVQETPPDAREHRAAWDDLLKALGAS